MSPCLPAVRFGVTLTLVVGGCAGAPEPRPAHVDRTEVRAAALAAVRRTRFCGDVESTRAPVSVAGHHALPDGSLLVMVSCDFYAYQGRYRFARLLPNDELVTVSLIAPDDAVLEGLVDRDDLRAGELIGVPEMDPSSGEVTVLHKARGPGDCGVYATFDPRDATLTLTTARALTCEASDAAAARGDTPRLGPEWPIVFTHDPSP